MKLKDLGGIENTLVCYPSVNSFAISDKSDFILLGCKYCSLIENDLVKLNSFFYSFERCLNLMFPDLQIRI